MTESANTFEIALFPLHTVLFPGGLLPLRIFEPRYLEMVSDCLKHDRCFGVAAIEHGGEAGAPATSFRHGTLARIRDWSRRSDGLLGITAQGETRFRLLATDLRANKLIHAQVQLLQEPPSQSPLDRHNGLVEVLRAAMEQLGQPLAADDPQPMDATWLGYRICELLPLENASKTRLLAMDDAIQRLDAVDQILRTLRNRAH